MMSIFFKTLILFFLKFKIRTANHLKILLGSILISKSKNFYERYTLLEDAEIKIFSQNGEDGILNYLITKLEIKKPNFIEIGVGDYSECNTRFLYESYYSSGLIIDCIDDFSQKVRNNVNLWKGDLRVIKKFVNSKNIREVILANCDFTVDLISIDIDGIDYWVLKNFPPINSKIFVIEYNALFGSNLEITVPNIDNFSRERYHNSFLCYGASLNAYINLMNEKGYYFLGVNRLRNNAFFISKIYSKQIYFPKIDNSINPELTNALFRESRSKNGLLNYFSPSKRLNEILDCEVIDISKGYSVKKIKEII